VTATTPQAGLYANHGRWLYACDCGQSIAEVHWPVDTFVICLECRASHRFDWPAERADIDALLSLRPVENRNWHPGETTADLERENHEHGIGEAG